MSNTTTAEPAPTPTHTPWWKNEDWLAVVAATPLLAAVALHAVPKLPSFGWSTSADLARVFGGPNLLASAAGILIFLAVSAAVLLPSLGRRTLDFVLGAAGIIVLALLAQFVASQKTIKELGLEYVLFALGIGLLVGHTTPLGERFRPALRTELFIKIGVVLLGATIRFPDLLRAGTPGLIQAILVIPIVWQACFFLARRLRVDDELAVMLSTAVSICGVSAAIAACGAIQGDKKKLSYVTSVVLLCAVPMMILLPWIVRTTGMSPEVGGAWIGGTLDTSGSVAAATELVSPRATEIGMIVKLSQNVLIGVAAFALSVGWAMRDTKSPDGTPTPRPGLGVIWERFPKFTIGFIAASLVFSFGLDAEAFAAAKPSLDGLRHLWFAAAFVTIGLETDLRELATLGGGRPALAFLGGQFVNVLWTLALATWLFG